MLDHQLPSLLPVNAFWDALPEIFDWLHGQVPAPVLAPMTMGANDSSFENALSAFLQVRAANLSSR